MKYVREGVGGSVEILRHYLAGPCPPVNFSAGPASSTPFNQAPPSPNIFWHPPVSQMEQHYDTMRGLVYLSIFWNHPIPHIIS